MHFICYKDSSGKTRNTLKAYCYHLKAYSDFFWQKGVFCFDSSIDDMTEYMRWLQAPTQSVKVLNMLPYEPKHKAMNLHLDLTDANKKVEESVLQTTTECS